VTYLVGTDEAGYGPNLGPLVISATVWEVPDGVRSDDLYARLSGVVTTSAAAAYRSGADPLRRIAVADSKALYHSGHGIADLERGLLALLGALGRRPRTWRDLWTALAPDAFESLDAHPWYADYAGSIPIAASAAEIDLLSQSLAADLSDAGVRFIECRSRPIFETEFNDQVAAYGSKGELLSRETLRLVDRVTQPLGAGPIAVLCDKHGGRNAYAGLLGEIFPGSFIEVRGESRQQSTYRFGPENRRFEFRFQAKGETHLPTALASMASKYLRELAMEAFNEFWRRYVPDVTPTAGYPVDAKRFKKAIASAQAELGITDRRLWRSR
jgi:hypothetical protein